MTLPVLEYGSSAMVGTFCCDRNCRGFCTGCGNRKFCFNRGDIGINLFICCGMASEFMHSGLGNVFWRSISGDRFMYCGDGCRFGGDVGNNFMCSAGLGSVFCRIIECRFWKSGSLQCSGDLLYPMRFGDVGNIFGRCMLNCSVDAFDGNVDCRTNGG